MFSLRIALMTLVLALAGCASGVKLDDVQVEDRTGTSNSNNSGAVAQLDARSLGGLKPGPAGVSQIIYFDFDSFTIKPEFQAVLEAHARHLRNNPELRANLEGHTDERGGREYNLALGQKRSEAVRRALTVLGVPDARMEAVSFGQEKPADSGTTEAAYAKNRRVEFIYR
ncbi:MAG: peptidoglycan-associated lipoprotein Pal [Limnohabitans sp.]|jgi:peptidoglycan-associated lipoprotein|nr:peptidoglycan-associated lipoprotein Pal [Limnohabitans sp.]